MSSIAARFREGHAREAALAALCAILFLTFLDNTIVSVALADIQSSLGASVPDLQWIVDGYMLAFAALMLTGGTLGDLFGRKKVMLAGVAIFCGGSVMSALAPGTSLLIAGRVVMGVGAAASEPGTLSMIRHIYPEPAPRARALGVWAAVSGLALALGPVIGGVLVGAGDWTWIFWFSVGLAALCFAAAAVTLTESSDPKGGSSTCPAWSTGAGGDPGRDVRGDRGREPRLRHVVDRPALRSCGRARGRSSSSSSCASRIRSSSSTSSATRRSPPRTCVAFATNLSVFSVFFFTALYLQLIAGFDGFHIALVFSALAVAMIVAGPIAGRWTARAGPRVPMVIGCALAGLGLLLVDHQLTATTDVAALVWPLAIAGLGFGIALVTMTEAVLGLVPPEESGMAASTVNTSRELGGVFGVAVLGSVVNAQLTGGLTQQARSSSTSRPVSLDRDQVRDDGRQPERDAESELSRSRQRGTIAEGASPPQSSTAGHGIHLSLQIAGGDRARRGGSSRSFAARRTREA